MSINHWFRKTFYCGLFWRVLKPETYVRSKYLHLRLTYWICGRAACRPGPAGQARVGSDGCYNGWSSSWGWEDSGWTSFPSPPAPASLSASPARWKHLRFKTDRLIDGGCQTTFTDLSLNSGAVSQVTLLRLLCENLWNLKDMKVIDLKSKITVKYKSIKTRLLDTKHRTKTDNKIKISIQNKKNKNTNTNQI